MEKLNNEPNQIKELDLEAAGSCLPETSHIDICRQKVLELLESGLDSSAVCNFLGISRSFLYKELFSQPEQFEDFLLSYRFDQDPKTQAMSKNIEKLIRLMYLGQSELAAAETVFGDSFATDLAEAYNSLKVCVWLAEDYQVAIEHSKQISQGQTKEDSLKEAILLACQKHPDIRFSKISGSHQLRRQLLEAVCQELGVKYRLVKKYAKKDPAFNVFLEKILGGRF